MLGWLAALTLAPPALGRDVVHRGRPAAPSEAWFALTGPTECPVQVHVGPDGRPRDAHPDGCPAVLGPALREAALQWRWSVAASGSLEEIEVPIRPPAFSPHKRQPCVVGFEVRGTVAAPLAEAPARCAIEAGPVPAAERWPPDRRVTAWCAVEVTVSRGEAPAVELAECAEGYREAAAAAIRSFRFPADRPQRWRVLLGYPVSGSQRP